MPRVDGPDARQLTGPPEGYADAPERRRRRPADRLHPRAGLRWSLHRRVRAVGIQPDDADRLDRVLDARPA